MTPSPSLSCNGVLVSSRVGVAVGVDESVGDGMNVGVGESVDVGLNVGVAVGVGVNTSVGVGLNVGVAAGVGVNTSVGVGLNVGVAVGVGVNTSVGVGLNVGVAAGVGVNTSVGVGVVACGGLFSSTPSRYWMRRPSVYVVATIVYTPSRESWKRVICELSSPTPSASSFSATTLPLGSSNNNRGSPSLRIVIVTTPPAVPSNRTGS